MIKKVFPIIALAVFSTMLGAGIIAPLLPLYSERMGATGIWVGIIFGAFFFSRTLIMPIVGRLSDRGRRKPYLTTGLLALAIISLGYIPADSVLQLTIVRLVHGAATGMILPIAQAYVGDIAPKGEEGRWMGYFQSAFFAGFGVGPLLGGLLTEHLGMTFAFSTMSGLNFIAFLGVLFFLPNARTPQRAAGSGSSFHQLRDSNAVKGLFLQRLSFALGRGIFATFLPLFAALYLGLNTSLIGILLATNMLLMALLQGFSGGIADRFDRRTLVILGSTLTLAFLALIPLTHSFWPLLGICVLGGLGGALFMPSHSAMTVDEGKKFGMGSTMALMNVALSIGMAIGPLIGGGIEELVNIDSVFYSAAGIMVVGTGLFAWYTR